MIARAREAENDWDALAVLCEHVQLVSHNRPIAAAM